jgi:hypothetical protein
MMKVMWLDDWKGSRKGAYVYAKGNGLNPQTFVKWTKEGSEVPKKFLEVKAIALEPEEYAPEILTENGDVKIHIPLRMNR